MSTAVLHGNGHRCLSDGVHGRRKSVDDKSEDGLRSDVRSRLVKEMQFPEDLAEVCERIGTGCHLLRLLDEGFTMSERDPLLFLVPDLHNEESLHYFNNGNFGLPPGSPGSLPWPGGVPPAAHDPLPAGVVQRPPFALGRFISSQPGVQDLSHGSMLLFYVENLEFLFWLSSRIQDQRQFRRIGPQVAADFGVAAHEPLIRAYTLDRLRGPSMLYPNFAHTA
mmetsp:Transcript_32404/g.50474  ORF Transcript_32404/g.50474 Transcript_32404/m.50474 type:complete len:222 (-) Transcript_32404:282-947(-)